MKSTQDRRDFLKSLAGTAAAASVTARSFSAIAGAGDRLRLGVIGCGGMAGSHMDALLTMKESDNVEIGAVCDIWEAPGRRCATNRRDSL